MSDYNIETSSQVDKKKRLFIEEQLKLILEENNEEISDAQFQKEVHEALELSKDKPLYQNRKTSRHEIPYKEDFEEDMTTIRGDLHILNEENKLHSQFLKDSFNSVHSEKKRIMQRIDALNSLTGDMFLITDEENKNTHYITESFNDSKALDTDFSVEAISKGSIQTEEGLLTLERISSKNLSENGRIAHVSGNGEEGIDHIVRKTTTVNSQGVTEQAYRFLNEQDKNMNTRFENILDDRPDTLFEYQMINVPNEFKKARRHYDFEWAKGEEEGETLRLKLVVELDKEEDINWLTLMPYYPSNSSGRLLIHSIRTSVDGFDYLPLYKEGIINEYINLTPQTYRLTDVFTGQTEEDSGFYQGRGVWSFPERRARFIEFVIDQKESYKETLGQAVYYMNTDNQNYPIQVEEPEELKNLPPGKYIRNVDGARIEYLKQIDATTQGWRYAIGLRDINIMQFQFNPKSEFISKRYTLPRNAQKLSLHAKEIIPESYLDIVHKNNDWIQYEITFDDVNWHRISPLHHEPLSDNFPAKILEVNRSMIDLTNAFQVHKKFIETDDAKHFRFRVAMHRPIGEGFESTTPILEEVAFKIELEGDL